jgi:hypothetical protein
VRDERFEREKELERTIYVMSNTLLVTMVYC